MAKVLKKVRQIDPVDVAAASLMMQATIVDQLDELFVELRTLARKGRRR